MISVQMFDNIHNYLQYVIAYTCNYKHWSLDVITQTCPNCDAAFIKLHLIYMDV